MKDNTREMLPIYNVDEAFGMKDEEFALSQMEEFVSHGKSEKEKIHILMTMFFPDMSYPRELIAKVASKIKKGKL